MFMNDLAEPRPAGNTNWLGIIVSFLVLVWILGVSFGVQLFAAFASVFPGEILHRADIPFTLIFVSAGLVQCAALSIVLVPLGLFSRAPRYSAAIRTWLAGSLFLLFLTPVRLVLTTYPQLTLLLQTVLAIIFSMVVWFLTGRGKIFSKGSQTALALAFAAGIVCLLPWAAWGALGDLFDIGLGSITAGAFGLAATLLVTRVWLRGMEYETHGGGWNIIFGGLVVGALLVIMASGYGYEGAQVLMMLLLGAFGWLVMSLACLGRQGQEGWNESALFTLISFAVAAQYLFLDPNTGVIQSTFGAGEALSYAFRMVETSAALALLGGLILLILNRRAANWRQPRIFWLSAAALALVAIAVYFTVGRPGLYGQGVFVILKDQADVASAQKIADYQARRTYVYQTLTQNANTTQQDLRATLDRVGIHYTPYYLVNALRVDADLPVVWWLLQRSDVAEVLPAPMLRPLPQKPPIDHGPSTRVPSSPDWNLTLIGADRVWNELGVRGKGIIVGQSDSGADASHPEISAQYRGNDGNNDYNWLDPWYHTPTPTDIQGHGTHTLGSMVGKNVGVAPDAQWYGCVNLARNLGSPPLYLNCMQFMLAPYPQNGDALRDGDPSRGAMVINNSWGCPDLEGCDANALLAGVRALRDAGVFVVVSAGNDGPYCDTVRDPLALYDDVFSVGAIDRNKQLADFSSRGPVEADGSGRIKPDISAPGEGVYSSLPGGTYGIESGTSMAGPHLVGVVALMWSANPKLIGKIDETEKILRETAQPASISSEKITCGDPNTLPNDLEGYGIVDAYAAVKRAIAFNP